MNGAAADRCLFWAAPHRPLFLAAFLWAILCIAIWPMGGAISFHPDLPGGAIHWHAHEMIFGFGGAAVGGYLLTALPSWSGRDPIAGTPLMALTCLWLAARFAVFNAATLPAWLPGGLSGGYFVALALILLKGILSARAHAKLIFPAVLILFAAASFALLSETGVLTIIAPLLLLAFLQAFVASRAVPAFTTNWMQLTRRAPLPAVCTTSRMAALLLLAAAILLLTSQRQTASGILLLGAVLAMLGTSRGWQSGRALRDPLICSLHLSWYWLIGGLALLGTARLLGAAQLETSILHATGIGALSTKIMAIAGRAAARRTGGALVPGHLFLPALVLIWLSAFARLLPLPFPAFSTTAHLVTALLWCAGWALFILYFRPALTGPPLRPVFSGPKASAEGHPP